MNIHDILKTEATASRVSRDEMDSGLSTVRTAVAQNSDDTSQEQLPPQYDSNHPEAPGIPRALEARPILGSDGKYSGKYAVYSPEGCVTYNGETPEAVTPADTLTDSRFGVEYKEVEVDAGGTIFGYLVVKTEESESESGSESGSESEFPEFVLTSDASYEDPQGRDTFKIRIARIGNNPLVSQQITLGAVHIGGGGGGEAVPGNFDPVFEDGVLSYTSDGFYPYGRKFKYEALPTVDESAKIGEGIIYLEVTHYETGSGSTPVIKGTSDSADFNNESKEVTNIPLYRLKGGAMVQDYRSVMSLVLRDL